MKKLHIILLSSLMLGCTEIAKEESIEPRFPTRPKDVPATTCDGTPIEWTWKKQRAYDDGTLSLAKDSTGCVIAIIIKTN